MGGGFTIIPILIAFGIATGMAGRAKGGPFWIWFAIGFFAPFVGLVAAWLHRSERDELRRECPGCGQILKLHDAVCTKCGTELEFPDVAITPESGRMPSAV